jgi:siroheme synthase (precorrin-2 oxidase/ferrochelatase)
MELLPLFLKLAGRRVVLVGAGPVAAGKLDALVRAGADVRRIDPEAFQPADLDDAWLVVSAATARSTGGWPTPRRHGGSS